MALSDVFNEVKFRIQEMYPEEEGTSGFEHLIGDESLISYNGSYPRAVWVLPRPGRVDFRRDRVRQVGEIPGKNGRQLYGMGIPVEIHIWTKEIEDQEEDVSTSRPAGIITRYIRVLNDVMGGVEWEIESGGWEPKTSTEVGFVFVLSVMIWFGVYDAMSAVVTLKDTDIPYEIDNEQ